MQGDEDSLSMTLSKHEKCELQERLTTKILLLHDTTATTSLITAQKPHQSQKQAKSFSLFAQNLPKYTICKILFPRSVLMWEFSFPQIMLLSQIAKVYSRKVSNFDQFAIINSKTSHFYQLVKVCSRKVMSPPNN